MRRRAVGLFFICSAVVPLAIVSTAWACGVLATMKADRSTAGPGSTVTVRGQNYGSCMQGGAGCTSPTATQHEPVRIRLDNRSATPLPGGEAVVPTGSTGRIEATVTIPAGTSTGAHLLLATQKRADGVPKSGTPGRTRLLIDAAAARGASSAPGAAWGPSADPSGPTGGAAVTLDGAGSDNPAMLPTVLGILLSIGLLGTGLTLARRPARRPALGV